MHSPCRVGTTANGLNTATVVFSPFFSIFAVRMQTIFNRYSAHYHSLTALGLPIVVGQVGTIVLGFADTLMVGHHSMVELAAASFVNTLMTLFIVFALGFSYGLTPIVGQLSGRGEDSSIGGVMHNGLAANLVLATIIVALLTVIYANIGRLGQPEELLPLMRPYWLVSMASMPFVCVFNCFKQFYDGLGHTKVPMYVLIGGNVLNIVGNYLLIYGAFGLPELGLLGAGIATLASRVAMCLALLVVFFASPRYRLYSRGFLSAHLNKAHFRHVNALGWPVALQMGMETSAFSLTAILVGWIGTTALAAHQIMLTVSQLFYMVYYGMAAAVSIRVSHFHGQRDLRAANDTATAGFHLILLIACIVSVPIFLLRSHIGLWFTDSNEVCALVAQAIVVLIVYQFGDGLQCTFANAMRGLACVKPAMGVAFFSYFIVSLPLSWLLGIHLGFGLVGIWAAFPVCLTCAGVLYYTFFRRALRAEAAKAKQA